MSNTRIGMTFMNGMGNFIFFTAAIKILRNWGYEDITLITDGKLTRTPFLLDVVNKAVDNVVTEFDPKEFDRIYGTGWSKPASIKDDVDQVLPQTATINWHTTGIHEVQAYLEMIGASWKDFDGYIFEMAGRPQLRSSGIRIALANCSTTNQAVKKRWGKFPELSKRLDELGYKVYLLGMRDELEGCVGIDYTDKLNVFESAKVLSQCDLLIASSTGLTVVADAVGTPVLLLEGPMPTFKNHPLQVKYDIVRKYIACAPCLQKSVWKICDVASCMDKIEVGDVIQRMLHFLPKLRGAREMRHLDIRLPVPPEPTPVEKDAQVVYLIPCRDRYYMLKTFLDSFIESKPLPGLLLFVNDASTDPRVSQLLEEFEIDGLEKMIFTRASTERIADFSDYPKSAPSKFVYNYLIDQLVALDREFDYVMIIDPDILVRPYWIQRMIKIFEEAKEQHKIATISGLHAFHGGYDDDSTSRVYETSYGNYRIRRGNNIPYLTSWKLFFDVHKKFDQHAINGSSDISKFHELCELGYMNAVLTPSEVEHIGAFQSLFKNRRTTLISEDYCE